MTGELAIPLDDSGLDAIEHALGGVIHIEDDGEWRREGADYGLSQLLNFWSGYDPRGGVLTGYIEDIPVYHSDKPCLSEHDLIRALVAEVRRLRSEAT